MWIVAMLVLAITPARGVEVTYLANEGYLIQGRDAAVLVDAFIPEPKYGYHGLTAEHWAAMEAAQAPFHRVVAAVASHEHADHIQPAAARSFLENHPVPLYTTPAAIAGLALERDTRAAVTPMLPDYGRETTVQLDGVSLTFLRLQHHASRDDDTQNLGVIIHIDDVRILHVGDAYPLRDNFAPFGLANRDIDLALIPDWFFDTDAFPEGADIIEQLVNARRVVPTHLAASVTATELEALKSRFPRLHLMHARGDQIVVEARSPAYEAQRSAGGQSEASMVSR